MIRIDNSQEEIVDQEPIDSGQALDNPEPQKPSDKTIENQDNQDPGKNTPNPTKKIPLALSRLQSHNKAGLKG